MGFEIPDLSDVDEQQMSGLPAEGWYDVVVKDCQPGKGKKEPHYDYLRFTFECDFFTRDEWVTFTPKTLPNVKAKLLILGVEIPQGKFKIEEATMIGRKCQIYVVHKPYFDTATNEQKMGLDIKLWAKPGSHKTGGSSSVSPSVSGAPEGWGAAGVDDDIPF